MYEGESFDEKLPLEIKHKEAVYFSKEQSDLAQLHSLFENINVDDLRKVYKQCNCELNIAIDNLL